MSVIGNPLTVGGGNKKVVAAMWSTKSGTTYSNIGYGGGSNLAEVDGAYFSESSGTLTCVKAGAYTIDYFATGSRNTSGTDIYSRWRIYHNSAIIASATNTTQAAPASASINVTLAVGDTIYGTVSNSTGTTYVDAGYYIKEATA